VARTQAILYRDKHGIEPVGEFIETLPAKRKAKIYGFLDKHLNGQPPDGWMRNHVPRLEPPAEMLRLGIERGLDLFINIDKLLFMRTGGKARISPKGRTVADAARDQARRSEAYREARDEYAAIEKLRARNWIAAHLRERRYELELTQKEVADQAGTSHSFISKVEGGDHIPTIPVLKRILAVLDEELLIGFERRNPDEEPEREVAPAPELAAA
jgi:DNA-binding XRE family transcriptional regulator